MSEKFRKISNSKDRKKFIQPDVKVWLDVEEVESHLKTARWLETADAYPEAIQQLEIGVNRYLGDFLAEDLDEEWTVPIRARLRLSDATDLYEKLRRRD